MPRNSSCPRPLTLALAVACALAAMPVYSQTTLETTTIVDMQSVKRLAPSNSTYDQEPAVASAEAIEGSPETELIMTGDAEIRRPGTMIKADRLTYTQSNGEVTARGNASISRDGAIFRTPQLRYQLTDKTGQAEQVDYEYAPMRLRGEASCARFLPFEQTELVNSLITTCKKGDNSWWIEIEKLTLDEYEQVGYGRNAVLKLGGVPVIGAPWFTFPMSPERKSGFLIPSFGMSSSRGFELQTPYYFNIAPNYDYTFTPHLMTKRGLLLGNNVRWLNQYFETSVTLNYMPDDKEYEDERYGASIQLKGSFKGLSYGIDYKRVSDNDFISDFSNSVRDDTEDVLAQNYWLSYGQKYWSASLTVNKNQTIDIHTDKPYEKVPEFTWRGYVADFQGFEFKTTLQATRFEHPTKISGDRFVFDQSVAYPIRSAGWFVTPKARVVGTSYDLERAYTRGASLTPGVTVPVFSVDSGLIFDREVRVFDLPMMQTLEPRLFYSYTPYRDQSDIPVFDSSLAEMTFAQLFNEDTWIGYDRFNEANQLSASITTRFIDDRDGYEWFRASIGERVYFNDYRIGSNGKRQALKTQKSDFLASIGAHLTRSLQASVYTQWSHERNKTDRLVAGVRYQPRPMSSIGLFYRYNWEPDRQSEDYIKQVDLSLQWPLSDKWYVLARQNYSLYKRKFIESLLGLEYHADCWTMRVVAQRYTDDNEEPQSNFFIQLELNGLGSLGSSPMNELQRSIQGYQPRSTVITDPTRMGPYDYYY